MKDYWADHDAAGACDDYKPMRDGSTAAQRMFSAIDDWERDKRSPSDGRELFDNDFSIESLVEAWLRVGGRTPTSVELVKNRTDWSTVVYRLSHDTSDHRVIAKGLPFSALIHETAVFQEVLPNVPVSILRCLGSSVASSGTAGFIFLEDAGHLQPNPQDTTHSRLVGHWLAAVHCHSVSCTRSQDLAIHHMDRYSQYCERGIGNLAAVNRSRLSSYQIDMFRHISVLLGRVMDYLPIVEAHATRLPSVLVHGDLSPKNMRLSSELDVLVFDWEMGGHGSPAVDMAILRMEFDSAGWHYYAEKMLSEWNDEIDYDMLRNATQAGSILRLTAGLFWATAGILAATTSPSEERVANDWYLHKIVDRHLAVMGPQLSAAIDDLLKDGLCA